MATYSTIAVTFALGIIIGFVLMQPPKLLFSTKECDAKDVEVVTNDVSQALTNAWKLACGSTGRSVFKLTTNNSTVGPLTFDGPCKATKMVVNVVGDVIAIPKASWPDNSADAWIKFTKVQNLEIFGRGKFIGNGKSGWWKCKNSKINTCENNPTALAFHNCNNLNLIGVTSIDSPRNHITINHCNGTTISNINLIAYGMSPNTDGIDISDTNGVHINGGHIGTGDDCIAINGGSFNINITGLNCGPGHGISIGSLGRNSATEEVSNIMVMGATFTDTQNGVRIKTVPGGSGSASHITFSNIGMTRVQNPILLTQFYCPHVDPKDCKNKPQMVKISDVTFSDIHGTSATSNAINITCSPNKDSCVGITLRNINITPNTAIATCKNAVDVHLIGNVTPYVKCTRGADVIEMPLDHDDYNESQRAIATS
ncbi:hypothetical protein QVD17_13143 [Tagetes erecta]|uniref:Polygalacturonase n=1 Tax=Tagetes erecta TaxID=13708 RepID=A0AAD8P1Z3_TARER|nr:hypothetical protein QVD17_13143 [Tagetes erecta]